MSRVHNGFIFQFAIGTGQHCDHVIGFEWTNLADHMRFQLRRQRYRTEIARLRVRHHLVEIHPRVCRQLFRDIELYP